jgi:replicative DNA helicase
MLLSGTTDVSAANLYQMGPLLRRVADVCLQSGATPILVHHFNRAGAMSTDPPSLENLAFAGIGEFARQWLLINRRQKFEPGSGIHNLWLAVGGSAGQSALFAVDVDEGQMAGDLTGRQWRVVVNSPEDARNSERDERERHRSEQQREQVLHTALRVERYLQRVEGGDSGSKIREEIGVGAPKCQEALEWLIGQHRVEAAMVRRGNGQAYPGYRVAVAPPQEPPPG